MTMINTLPRSGGRGFVTQVRNFFAGIAEGYALRNEYQRTIEELQRLSERELEDIGLVRADIPAVAARRTLDKLS